MDHVNQGNNLTPEVPVKRKRGRPRKDESLSLSGSLASERVSKSRSRNNVSSAHALGISLMGQTVSGVVDGSFDAGYLITVKVVGTGTMLRGVVFDPGHCVPVTAANDVAPQVNMVKRNIFPFPLMEPCKEAPSAEPELHPRPCQGNIDVASTKALVIDSNRMHQKPSPAIQSGTVTMKDGLILPSQAYREKQMGKLLSDETPFISSHGSDEKTCQVLHNNIKMVLLKDGLQVPILAPDTKSNSPDGVVADIVKPNASTCQVSCMNRQVIPQAGKQVIQAEEMTNNASSLEDIKAKLTKEIELSREVSSIKEANNQLVPPENSSFVAETYQLNDVKVSKGSIPSKTARVLATEVPAKEIRTFWNKEIAGGSELPAITSFADCPKPSIEESACKPSGSVGNSLPREGADFR